VENHATLNLNKTCRCLLYFWISETSGTTWHSVLLYKLAELEFSTSPIKLIYSFLTDRKFQFLVEGEFSTLRKIVAGVPQCSILAPIFYRLYTSINNAPPPGTRNSSCSLRGRCLYLRNRETRMTCSLQTGTRPHCSEFVV
jgi:hypothetical protein